MSNKKETTILNSYLAAKEKYWKLGVNADEILLKLKKIAISIHCWQGDDVSGF